MRNFLQRADSEAPVLVLDQGFGISFTPDFITAGGGVIFPDFRILQSGMLATPSGVVVARNANVTVVARDAARLTDLRDRLLVLVDPPPSPRPEERNHTLTAT